MTVVRNYKAILAYLDWSPARFNANESLGTPVFITYSFVDGSNLPSLAEYEPYQNDGYSSLTRSQRANFRDVVSIVEASAGIKFVEVNEGGMIEVMNTSGSSWGGWAGYPSVDEYYYDSYQYLVIDNSGNYNEGSYAYLTMLHELGHALGLSHPHEGDLILSPSLDNLSHTVMTYNNSSSTSYPSILGSMDELALSHLYGSGSFDLTGWSYRFSNGRFVCNGTDRSNVIVGVSDPNKLSGLGGKDALYGRNQADTLNGGSGADTLVGYSGDDRLIGGSGRDLIRGGWGDDSLIGGRAKDIMRGDWGDDNFIFLNSMDSSRFASRADVIKDFAYGSNTIDLSAIDASTEISGSNTFTFIGTSEFDTSPEGGVCFQQFNLGGTANDYTMVYIDTDSDPDPEMSIKIMGIHYLTSSDFIL